MVTVQELDFIMKHGYSIRVSWIGPVEKFEYRVSQIGQKEILAYRKSSRAAFNFIKKDVDKRRKHGS